MHLAEFFSAINADIETVGALVAQQNLLHFANEREDDCVFVLGHVPGRRDVSPLDDEAYRIFKPPTRFRPVASRSGSTVIYQGKSGLKFLYSS